MVANIIRDLWFVLAVKLCIKMYFSSTSEFSIFEGWKGYATENYLNRKTIEKEVSSVSLLT